VSTGPPVGAQAISKVGLRLVSSRTGELEAETRRDVVDQRHGEVEIRLQRIVRDAGAVGTAEGRSQGKFCAVISQLLAHEQRGGCTPRVRCTDVQAATV